MITDITSYIKDWILLWPDLSGDCLITEDPGITYKDGLHLAYKHPIKGVLIKTSEESEYSGIDDRRGNFFYIRHVDDEQLTYNPVDNRTSSCLKDTQVTANLRLVSILKNIVQVHGNERYEVEEFLRNALLNLDFTAYDGIERNIEIELTLSRVNSPQVLAEERVDGAEPRGFELRNIFVAIDFILKFIFNVEKKGNFPKEIDCCDYFLPSKDLLNEMHDNLYIHGVGGFADGANDAYWSSSEYNAAEANYQLFVSGNQPHTGKGSGFYVRASRSFIAAPGAYSLRETGPCGGLIFYIDGNTYYEAAPSDQSANQPWSNITNVLIGTTGTAIGTGQANTSAIIGQAGHIDSAAKLANDLCT